MVCIRIRHFPQALSFHALAPIIAFGPLFLGPLSEVYGRSPVIQLSNMWYLSMRFTCLRMITNDTFLPSSLQHSMWLREEQE